MSNDIKKIWKPSGGFYEDTLILMFDGKTKKIQDIKPKDLIMCEDGKSGTVEEIGYGEDEMFEIIPIRGNKYVISGNHNLILKASNYEMIFWDNKRKRYRIRWLENFCIKEKSYSISKYKSKKLAYEEAKKYLTIEVPKYNGYTKYGDSIKIIAKKYFKLSKRIRDAYKCYSIGLKFKNEITEIDPYALGYWLGDGHTDSTKITTEDPEIVNYFKDFAFQLNLQITNSSKLTYDITTGTKLGGYERNPWRNFLKDYDLMGYKYIPDDFKFNSKENRLKLLAGLIDSDGYNSNNTFDFCLKSEVLVDDIIFLARSLGFYVAGKIKVKKTCTNAPRGPKEGEYFRFFICGKGLEKIPSILFRKNAHERKSKKDANVNGIKIFSIGTNKFYNFKLEINKPFLFGDFTITQNSI